MTTALVIGATGLVGRALVDRLLAGPHYAQVHTFVRRPSLRRHERLVEHIVDFDQPAAYAHLVRGDVLFSALGTTIRQAGSEAAQYKVDHGYQLDAAKAAAANGVPCLVLVSAVGASPRSRVFYSRMKGELERDVQALGLRRLHILQPSFLDGPREASRPMERLGIAATQAINALGLLRRWRPVPADTVAAAMLQAAALPETGPAARIWELDALFDLAEGRAAAGLRT